MLWLLLSPWSPPLTRRALGADTLAGAGTLDAAGAGADTLDAVGAGVGAAGGAAGDGVGAGAVAGEGTAENAALRRHQRQGYEQYQQHQQ